ncbi:MAG: amidohydrolase family protein [Eggerthellaceae bacterium]|nr:amidohydrolase family protein [Eggerthellaceae bacterium]
MRIQRGFSKGLLLQEWLKTKNIMFNVKWAEANMRWVTLGGVAELVRSNCTSIFRIYLNMKDVFDAIEEAKFKSNLCRIAIYSNDSSFVDLPAYPKVMQLIELDEARDDNMITASIFTHSEYLTTDTVCRALNEIAHGKKLKNHIYIREPKLEIYLCKQHNGGKLLIKFLADLGALDYGCFVAHCEHLLDSDIEIFRAFNVFVCACSKGNSKFYSGTCDVHSLHDAGVNVALGTDAVSSNNNMNMPEGMPFFSYLKNGTYNDSIIRSPKYALYSMIHVGAKVMGKNVGYVKEGFDVDMCMLDVDQSHLWSSDNKYIELIFFASTVDIVLAICNGKFPCKDSKYAMLDIVKV